MQRHDGHAIFRFAGGCLHDERDVFEKGAQILEILHRAHEFLQVLKPASRVSRAVSLPHRRVAAFLQDGFAKLMMGGGVEHRSPAGEAVDQVAQGLARLRLQLLRLDDEAHGLDHRNLLPPRIFMHDRDRGIAKAALWYVDDALEGEIIGRLADAAKIGERIADFGALIEARTADDAIGNADRDETLLEFPHLKRGTHKNGHLVERMVLVLELFDLLGHQPGFLFRIPRAGDGHFLAMLAIGEQRLAKPALIVGDEMRGGGEDVPGRAVIALELDHGRAGKIMLEAQDIVDLRPAPAIDRLVVVADAADVAAALRQQSQPEILRDIRVLVLIDEDVAEAVLVIGEHIGVRPPDAQAMQQQVAEIAGVQRFHPGLVGGVELAPLAVGENACLAGRHRIGCQAAVFPSIDEAGKHPGRPALVVDVFGAQHLLHQADLVVGVENGEIGAKPDELGMAAQQLGRDRMEGGRAIACLPPHRRSASQCDASSHATPCW